VAGSWGDRDSDSTPTNSTNTGEKRGTQGLGSGFWGVLGFRVLGHARVWGL
jgi:hypothetical protein